MMVQIEMECKFLLRNISLHKSNANKLSDCLLSVALDLIHIRIIERYEI